MQGDELTSGGDSDHTDSERSVGSLDNHSKHSILPYFSAILSELLLLGDAELASITDRLAVLKTEGAPSAPDSAISIERSSVITATTAGVTQFSEVSYNNYYDIIPMLPSNCDLLTFQDLCDRDLEDVSMGLRQDVALRDNGDRGEFKLHIASQKGDLQEVMRLVEEEHLSPLQIDKHGITAIHYASWYGHLNVLRYFIKDRGCNAACQDQDGWTTLHYAAGYKHLHLVQYLIEKQQVEPFSRNKRGHTALHQACAGGSVDVINYLAKEMSKYLPLKEVVHDRGHKEMIPMHCAALLGHLEAIKFLITDLNCDPNSTDYKNRTCVHLSAQGGHLHVVKYFIEQLHCDPSCLTVNRSTPLHSATLKGQQNVVQYLILEQHCDPMCTSKDNDTPLHIAARYGHLEIVKFLVETCQCPIETRGQHNMTPLEQARRKGHHNIVKYLESISST